MKEDNHQIDKPNSIVYCWKRKRKHSLKFTYKMFPKILLNMIVKNADDTISSCLESAFLIVDYFVIVDTGSTDNTVQLIETVAQKFNKEGEIYHRDWVNFSHNRNEAMQLARNKSEWILFLDADETISGIIDDNLTENCYLVNIVLGSTTFHRLLLVKNQPGMRWLFPVHEQLFFQKSLKLPPKIIPKIKVISKIKEENDTINLHRLSMLESELTKSDQEYDVDPYLSVKIYRAQVCFSAGQAARKCKQFEKAIKYYKQFLKIGSATDSHQVYESHLMIARCKFHLGFNEIAVIEEYLKAHQCKPEFAEPLFFIGKLLRKLKLFSRAESFLLEAINKNKPDFAGAIVYHSVYDWEALYEYYLTLLDWKKDCTNKKLTNDIEKKINWIFKSNRFLSMLNNR